MADPASLLGAAVQAACLAKTPRRTVQAVAAAVTAVLVKQEQDTAVARPGTEPRVTVGVPGTVVGACETQVLVDQLRDARRAKRQRRHPKTAQTLLTARQIIQPAEPNAAKPKPDIIPRAKF